MVVDLDDHLAGRDLRRGEDLSEIAHLAARYLFALQRGDPEGGVALAEGGGELRDEGLAVDDAGAGIREARVGSELRPLDHLLA